MADFCSVEDIEAALGMTAANPLAAEVAIRDVSAAIRGFLDQELDQGAKVYTLTAEPYSTVIILPDLNVTSVTSVTEDAIALVRGTDYQISTAGVLRRLGKYWATTQDGIVVSVTAGYAEGTRQWGLLRAVAKGASCRAYQNAMRAQATAGMSGVQSTSLPDFTQTYAVDLGGSFSMLLLPSERELLRRAFWKGVG